MTLSLLINVAAVAMVGLIALVAYTALSSGVIGGISR